MRLSADEEAHVLSLIEQGIFRADPVVDVMPVELGDVWDAEVEEDASFVAEGVVVHNSDICRMMHGKVFSVRSALAGFDRVERLSDPGDVKRASPWVRQKGGVLFVEHTSGRHELAEVVRSGVGARDDVGEFRSRVDDDALGDLIGSGPPFHGLCRSSSRPVD